MINKKANLVVVGGMIAAGKSTFAKGLASAMNWNYIPEILEHDPLQQQILKQLYGGSDRLHRATVQYYFLSNRLRQYETAAPGETITILDRGIWEDALFAKLLMVNEQSSYRHFQTMWHAVINRVITEYGKPQVYFFLKINWETFKKRIYSRNREAEIANFARNQAYFQDLLNEYNHSFEPLLLSYGIKAITIANDDLEYPATLELAIEQLGTGKLVAHKNSQL